MILYCLLTHSPNPGDKSRLLGEGACRGHLPGSWGPRGPGLQSLNLHLLGDAGGPDMQPGWSHRGQKGAALPQGLLLAAEPGMEGALQTQHSLLPQPLLNSLQFIYTVDVLQSKSH